MSSQGAPRRRFESPERPLGRRLPRLDGPERATGRAVYGADFTPAGAFSLAVVRSPHAHARITGMRAAPGIEFVTAADLPPIDEKTSGERLREALDFRGIAFAHDRALHHGHAVAVVAGRDGDAAREAAAGLSVEYEPLTPVLSIDGALDNHAPLLHPGRWKDGNLVREFAWERGDLAAGFAAADEIVEFTAELAATHQGYLEPQACSVVPEPDGRYSVYTSSQGHFTIRDGLALAFGLPLHALKIVALEIGGGFGGKINPLPEILALAAAMKFKRPVKLVFSRAEVLLATRPGAPARVTVKLGARKDGLLTAADAFYEMESGCYPGSPVGAAAYVGLAPYRLTNSRTRGREVVTNKPAVGAYRAPGATQAAFAVEQAADELALKLGLDPLEFRIKNGLVTGDPLPDNLPVHRVGYLETLAAVKKSPHWNSPVAEGAARGLAAGFWMNAVLSSSAVVRLELDGSVAVSAGIVDLTGTRTSLTQIAAEALEISLERVRFASGDTDVAPLNDESDGSRITYATGTAIWRAVGDFLANCKARVAKEWAVEPGAVDYSGGMFSAGDKKIDLAKLGDLAATFGAGPILGRGEVTTLKPANAFAVHLVDLSLDAETGKVTILRYTAAQDVGRAVNPPSVEGQIQGGVAQGIGWALHEAMDYDAAGRLRNPSLLDYRTPTALDLPRIETILVEVPAEDGPYGVRGVGEAPIVPPPAAIANALRRLTGARLTRCPMTSERLWGKDPRKLQVLPPNIFRADKKCQVIDRSRLDLGLDSK